MLRHLATRMPGQMIHISPVSSRVGQWSALSTIDKKKMGEMEAWARSQDKEKLERLAAKAAAKEDTAKEQLHEILGDHKLPENIMEKLIEWKAH